MQAAVEVPKEWIVEFCRRWGVSQFALFGSVLREKDFRSDSDVDVLVTFEPSAHPTLLTLSAMERELEERFGRKIDLVERRGLEQSRNPYRREEILGSIEVVHAQ